MFNFKKITAAMLSCAVITAALSACGDEESSDSTASQTSSSSDSESSAAEVSEGAVLNYTAPVEGEEIVVMTVKDYGDIKIKLFPELCPEGVENFVGLAKEGYYDGLTFHRVIEDFMIQGGDPNGNGTGGESIWGGQFDGGVTEGLYHFTGAIAYANSGSTSTDGSQFYIVTGPTSYDESTAQQYVEAYAQYGITMPQEAVDYYESQGGAWHLEGLSGNYTVFGQVFDGLDVAEAISKASTDSSDKPEEDIIIEKVSVEEYDGGDVRFFLSDY